MNDYDPSASTSGAGHTLLLLTMCRVTTSRLTLGICRHAPQEREWSGTIYRFKVGLLIPCEDGTRYGMRDYGGRICGTYAEFDRVQVIFREGQLSEVGLVSTTMGRTAYATVDRESSGRDIYLALKTTTTVTTTTRRRRGNYGCEEAQYSQLRT
jgi:hypothetical protein